MKKTILDTIVEHKKMEVLKRKQRKPVESLEVKALYNRKPLDPLQHFSSGQPNIIAEYKRKSPSKGMLSQSINPVPVVRGYKKAGAAASSILTDRDFFGGSFRDLQNCKLEISDYPLLRKDFIIDPYQVHEAKAYGADIILLIAAILDKNEVKNLARTANSLGLTVLLEVHNEQELEKWVPEIQMTGVNNRNLNTFRVSIETSLNLYRALPVESFKVSESGIREPDDIRNLYNAGYNGFLIGERFMASDDPPTELEAFISQLQAGINE